MSKFCRQVVSKLGPEGNSLRKEETVVNNHTFLPVPAPLNKTFQSLAWAIKKGIKI